MKKVKKTFSVTKADRDSTQYENVALAMVATAENTALDYMPLMYVMVALEKSPMFHKAVMEYAKDEPAIAAFAAGPAYLEKSHDDASYPIKLLCARMYLAGRFASQDPHSTDNWGR